MNQPQSNFYGYKVPKDNILIKSSMPDRRVRLFCLFLLFTCLFSGIMWRLAGLATSQNLQPQLAKAQLTGAIVSRPDIFDRNGQLLATDIDVPTLYAEPAFIMKPAVVARQLADLLPGRDQLELLGLLTKGKRRFIYLERGVTPSLAQKIFNAGLPGIGITYEKRRVYPKGLKLGHVLGYANIDNQGQRGIERYLDKQLKKQDQMGLKATAPVLSVDLTASHLLQGHLDKAILKYKAKSASALVMDVRTGEVIAMASNPYFDPQMPAQFLKNKIIDQNTSGVYELGSVFKVVSMAMALDLGLADLNSKFDVKTPLVFGKKTIKDHHAAGKELSLQDIFLHSSNVGTARIAALAGPRRHKRFLQRLGLLSQLITEVGYGPKPIVSPYWTKLQSATISFGHGIAVSPLQFTASVAALVNGGRYIPPTFIKRSAQEADKLARDVIRLETSKQIVSLLKANVTSDHGTGKKARSNFYEIGGKTGTSEKVVDGVYSKDLVRTSFISAFPVDKPKYIMYVMLDEPKALKATNNKRSASQNAAPLSREIIDDLGPLLGVSPL